MCRYWWPHREKRITARERTTLPFTFYGLTAEAVIVILLASKQNASYMVPNSDSVDPEYNTVSEIILVCAYDV